MMRIVCPVTICVAIGLLATLVCAQPQNPAADNANQQSLPPVRLITSFEDDNPFASTEADTASTVVERHATHGSRALRLERGHAAMGAKQNWTDYDYLKVDLHTESPDPVRLLVEIRDTGTTGYWTRVNYNTLVPPGSSTLILPVKQLYVGEKSRPGRMLDLANITRLVFSIGNSPHPLFIDNIRLEIDQKAMSAKFPELFAFDFQPDASCPMLEGFTPITRETTYTPERGFGLKNANISGGQNCLQPEPLYQDYLAITRGGLAVDLPNGQYRVWMNINRPAQYWGSVQRYRQRTVLAQGNPVLRETMDDAMVKERHFRFWRTDDLPTDNTFDKYQTSYDEKTFDVTVDNGQLFIEFQGDSDGCAVSAVVIFPLDKAQQGEQFLKFVQEQRRFHFDNYFKRTLPKPTGDDLAPTDTDRQRGYVTFVRDFMKPVSYHDTPLRSEIGVPMSADAFAGEMAPLTLGIVPLQNLGTVTVTPGDLVGPDGTIPASAIETGYVSYRLSRVTMEGSIYTIAPRLIMPFNSVEMPDTITRRFWLTVTVPQDARPGLYKGAVTITPANGQSSQVPVELRVRNGTLDPVDIPAGPWGYRVPYVADEESLKKMRQYGFNFFSSPPAVRFSGFRDGKPVLDFRQADALMARARELDFKAVLFYSSLISGYTPYYQDTRAMQAAGFDDYSEFVKAIYTAVHEHAQANNWLPYYINLGDEPIGDNVTRATLNSEAYTKAFPSGPPYFTFATSFSGGKTDDPHYALSKAVHIPNWNLHDEAGVKLMRDAGRAWAFYNGGNRWTYGDYMYKAAREFGMVFRVSWHWNVVVGDPYYALDCREDDYAWCNSGPDGQLIPAIQFEQLREGLGDYRRLLTLARLAKEKSGTPAAAAAEKLIADRMASFRLGQRNHDALFGADDVHTFRAKINDAIEALRQ